ncbi:PREDICTED: zinc finger protein 316-like [Priapulus caudatus]|uniref:Zinc finger protein 316-like n=1 Tax=Priapulus caudatus TaxID=37621 RepID=A0ABM1F4U5_PRICU|nr:PREDICTED: zinc finger protein 316-like [Priapulus caudatus]
MERDAATEARQQQLAEDMRRHYLAQLQQLMRSQRKDGDDGGISEDWFDSLFFPGSTRSPKIESRRSPPDVPPDGAGEDGSSSSDESSDSASDSDGESAHGNHGDRVPPSSRRNDGDDDDLAAVGAHFLWSDNDDSGVSESELSPFDLPSVDAAARGQQSPAAANDMYLEPGERQRGSVGRSHVGGARRRGKPRAAPRRSGEPPYTCALYERPGELRTHERGHDEDTVPSLRRPGVCLSRDSLDAGRGCNQVALAKHAGERSGLVFNHQVAPAERGDSELVDQVVPAERAVGDRAGQVAPAERAVGDRAGQVAPATSHACRKCGAWFRLRQHLAKHMVVVHACVKPFVCEVCPMAFARRSELVNHRRIHTGEKPHSCCMCSMAFAGNHDNGCE